MDVTMPTQLSDPLEPVGPTEAEAVQAKESSRRLAPYLTARDGLRLQIIEEGGQGEPLAVPRSALRLLAQILAEMAQGNAVTLIPVHAELTTQQAADLLNVSRPFLVKLLEEGKLPHRRVGKHRRIRFSDVLVLKRRSDEERRVMLQKLVAEGQEL